MNGFLPTIVTASAGGQGGKYLRIAHGSPNAYVTAVVEAYDLDRARDLAERYGGTADSPGCPVFATIEDAIAARVPYELAVLCDRPSEHEREMTAVLEDGKAALCEKPPTPDLASMRRVRRVEARSPGWVKLCFQLDRQYRLIADRVLRNEFGAPRLVGTSWLRCLMSPDEAAAELRSGKRRGQTGMPMDDLCHMLRAGIRIFPPGARIERVVGESWTDLDWMSAAVTYPWQGGWETGRVTTVAGWDVPISGLRRREGVSLAVQAAQGWAGLNFLVDNELPAGTVVPPEFYPHLVRVEHDGAIGDTDIKIPMPLTPDQCMMLLFEETVDLIRRGERPAEPVDGGMQVMQLLDAWRRSARTRHEVEVEPEDSDA